MLAPLVRFLTLFAALGLALPAWGQAPEDAGATVPQFKEGDTITCRQASPLPPGGVLGQPRLLPL
jgi:hypothetical protein